jgi:hypothetical protein
MGRLLIDYRNFGDLLSDYSTYCPEGDVWLVSGGQSFYPSALLKSSGDLLKAKIVEIRGSGDAPTVISIEQKGLFSKKTSEYEIVWSSDRQGWGEPPSSGSKTIHYFVPRTYMEDPPYTAEGMLVSLCKRNWISNENPFFPEDDRFQRCKTCTKRLEAIVAQQNI